MNMMNEQSVTQVIGLMALYWPSFVPKSEMAMAWTPDLSRYSREEVWEVLNELKHEETRAFAPSISEMLGRLEALRERAKTRETNRLALDGPRYSSIDEPTEVYSYKCARTTPAKKGDDPFEVRKAIRISRARFEELKRQKEAEGYRAVFRPIQGNGNGHSTVSWVFKNEI